MAGVGDVWLSGLQQRQQCDILIGVTKKRHQGCGMCEKIAFETAAAVLCYVRRCQGASARRACV